MTNTLVFIDEGFLSKVSICFGGGKRFKIDYIKFSKLISRRQDLFCRHIFYYTAPPFQSNKPTEKQMIRKRGYDKFVNSISKNKEITIREGRCQKTNISGKTEYHQKGVDALMVFDMASFPIKFPDVKTIIIITSDTDFCPIINEIKTLGINVILYTYYEKKRRSRFSVSHHLIDSSNEVYYLTKEIFENSILKK